MKVELVKRNLNPEIYFAPYDQIEQEVYNVNSKIYQKSNDVIVLAIRLENLGRCGWPSIQSLKKH